LRWRTGQPCDGFGIASCYSTFAVLVIGDFFHPINGFALESFLNGEMGHGGCWGRTMPVFFARSKPNDIAGPDFFNGSAFALRPAATGGDYKRLAERMGVPGRASAGLEGDAGSNRTGGSWRLKQGIDTDRAGKPIGGSFVGWLCARSFDFHGNIYSAADEFALLHFKFFHLFLIRTRLLR